MLLINLFGVRLSELRSQIIDFFLMARNKRLTSSCAFVWYCKKQTNKKYDFFEQWKPYVHQVSYYKRTDTDAVSGITSVSLNNTDSADDSRYCCTAAHGGTYVMPNMDVLPCCLYMYEAPYHGRDTPTKFSDNFWTDSNYKTFRSNLVAQQFESLCKNCNFWRAHEESTSTIEGYSVTENNYEKHIYIS